MVERNVELFAALHFVLVGFSHAFQPQPWEFVVPGCLFVAVGVLSFAAWAGLVR